MILIAKRPALFAGGWGYLGEEAGDEFEFAPPLIPARAPGSRLPAERIDIAAWPPRPTRSRHGVNTQSGPRVGGNRNAAMAPISTYMSSPHCLPQSSRIARNEEMPAVVPARSGAVGVESAG